MSLDTNAISHEWASRPDDQRFLSVPALHEYNQAKKAHSFERGVALDHLRIQPRDDGALVLFDPDKGNASSGAELSHWTFGQLCQRIKAPAGYLRTLPPTLAAANAQVGLARIHEDAKLLARRNGRTTLDAITSDSYGRIWDADVSGAILANVDLNQWKVPSASYASSNPKRATTLYASDRDMFLALVNDTNPIEVPGENAKDVLYRGFYARNSEVGAATFELVGFLYRYICDNRIIWGGKELFSVKIRHTSGGPHRYLKEAAPSIQRYLNAKTTETVDAIKAAREHVVAQTEAEVVQWLRKQGFAEGTSKRSVEIATANESNPRSLWGVVQGLTGAAHELSHNDDRLDLEKAASRLLDTVAL